MIKADVNMSYKIIHTLNGFFDYYLGDLEVLTDNAVIHKTFTCSTLTISNLVSKAIEKQLFEIIQKWGDNNA